MDVITIVSVLMIRDTNSHYCILQRVCGTPPRNVLHGYYAWGKKQVTKRVAHPTCKCLEHDPFFEQ